MNAKCMIENVKVLNVVEKENTEGNIKWFELVFMQGSDINTVTVDKTIAPQIESDNFYHLELTITEQIKTTRGGLAYKSNKFKITNFWDVED